MSLNYIEHIGKLHNLLTDAEASDHLGQPISMDVALQQAIDTIGTVHGAGGKVMIVGNGGSAAIASHLAIDLVRNGGVAAMTFNDASSITCLGNDFGYTEVFTRQLALHSRPGDLLIAISSSGASANILNAVDEAKKRGCSVMTLSGFLNDNPLRSMGKINFYVESDHYGRVELSHMTLCHALLDLSGGWV